MEWMNFNLIVWYTVMCSINVVYKMEITTCTSPFCTIITFRNSDLCDILTLFALFAIYLIWSLCMCSLENDQLFYIQHIRNTLVLNICMNLCISIANWSFDVVGYRDIHGYYGNQWICGCVINICYWYYALQNITYMRIFLLREK